MERYLLFDSGCSTCSKIARAIEQEIDAPFTVRSLRDPEIQDLLNRAHPDWRWEPTWLEVRDDEARAYTDLAMGLRLVRTLGPRPALRLTKLVNRHSVSRAGAGPADPGRRHFLRRSGALLVALPLLDTPALRQRLASIGPGIQNWEVYSDPDYGFLQVRANRLSEAARRGVVMIRLLVMSACTQTRTVSTPVPTQPAATTVAPGITATLSVVPSMPESPIATPSPAAGPAPTATPEPLPPLPSLPPGWTWYEDPLQRYAIAYPQTWMVHPPYLDF